MEASMLGTAAILLPDYGNVRSKVPALGPSLKRGEGPRQPRFGYEKSMWPHLPDNKVALVPLNLPVSQKRAQRVLVVDEEQHTPTPSASSRPKQQRVSKTSLRHLASPSATMPATIQTTTKNKSEDENQDLPPVIIIDDFASMPGVCIESALVEEKQSSCGETPRQGDLGSSMSFDPSRSFGMPKASLSSVSWQKCFSKRPRGCPLDCDFGVQESRNSGSVLVAAGKATTSPTKSKLLSLAPAPTPHATLDSTRLRFVELEGSQSMTDLHESPSMDEFSQISGRPLFKGQIRTFIPPVCTPLAAATMQSPAERYGYELSASPSASRLLKEAHSIGSMSNVRDSSSQDFAKMSQTCAPNTSIMDSIVSDGINNEMSPSLSKVPNYFLPFITPMGLSLKEPRSRVTVRVPPVRCSSEPFLPKSTLRGKERAAALLVDFTKMRRGANPRLWHDDGNANVATQVGLQYSLMDLCICDLQDTPETLKEGIKILRESKDPALMHGAACHPTIGVTDRTLLVAERKYKLLSDVVYPLRNSLEFNNKMDFWIDTLFAGADPEEIAGHCFGVREALKRGIHQPHGRPQDGDLKSTNFPLFLKTFGLPAEHRSVLEARAQLKDTCEIWAEKCSTKAKEAVLKAAADKDENPKSPEAFAIERMEYFLENFGTHEDSKWLLELGRCKEAARAAAVLRYAQVEDKYRTIAGAKDPVFKAAQRVEQEVNDAVEFGVEKDHPDLAKAITVGHHLRGEAIHRYALEIARSAGTRLGDAEAAAQKIEVLYQEALTEKGVPPDIEELDKADKVVLQLREDEGKRKREANAKKRAEDAAKKAAMK